MQTRSRFQPPSSTSHLLTYPHLNIFRQSSSLLAYQQQSSRRIYCARQWHSLCNQDHNQFSRASACRSHPYSAHKRLDDHKFRRQDLSLSTTVPFQAQIAVRELPSRQVTPSSSSFCALFCTLLGTAIGTAFGTCMLCMIVR